MRRLISKIVLTTLIFSFSLTIETHSKQQIGYYTSSGKSYHFDEDCSTLSNSKNVLKGELSYVKSIRRDPCDKCAYGSGIDTNTTQITSQTNKKDEKEDYLEDEETADLIARPAYKVNEDELTTYLKNAYLKALDREMDEDGEAFWKGRITSGMISVEDFILNIISTDEFNKISKTSEDMIKRLYSVIFMREPDKGGLKFWIDEYSKDKVKTKDSTTSVKNVVKRMLDSKEFKLILGGIRTEV